MRRFNCGFRISDCGMRITAFGASAFGFDCGRYRGCGCTISVCSVISVAKGIWARGAGKVRRRGEKAGLRVNNGLDGT